MQRHRTTLLALLLAASAIATHADPKKPVPVTGTSPFANCFADATNLQQGTVSIGSEVEPWVAMDPTNKDHIIASWQQDRWSTGGARGLVTAVTFDGGRYWHTEPLPGLTPCTNNPDFIRASDPWLSFAPNGDVYHVSLIVSQSLIDILLGAPGTGRSAMMVHKSINGGVTWQDPVPVVDEDFNGLHDKQTITADPLDSNYVYIAWDRLSFVDNTGSTMFARTVDGGDTWEPAKVIYAPGPGRQSVANQIVVLPDGTLLLFFTDVTYTSGNDALQLAVMRSVDHGENWSSPLILASMEPTFNLTEPDSGTPIRGGEELFDVAVDSASGVLYAVWQDGRFSQGAHESVAMILSEDGGHTWTQPVQINRTPANLSAAQQQAFIPSVEVNSKGEVAVTYYDFRFNGPGGQAATDAWAVTCRPKPFGNCAAPGDWSAEIRLTGESFDLGAAPLADGFFLGDYAGLAASGDEFGAVFAISASGDPASLLFRAFKEGPQGIATGRQK